ncbi:MAG: hypothetical protein IJR99_00900, partial [Kiritimatiellae bacterium]|nr:hypothetical protein [Kiritimatiellia bacterium]
MSNPIGTVWTVVIFGLLCLCAFVRLAERRSPRRILLPFRAGGWLERIALFLLVAYAAYVGGSKPGGLRIPVVPEGGGIPVEVAVIPTNRYLAGFVRTEARFGEAFDFSVPAGVQAYPFWRSRGAFEDVFRLPLPSVRAFGGNAFVTNAYVFPSGIIALSLPPVSSAVRTNEDERGTTAFAPFSAPLGFAPESFDRPGAFWSDATPSNSLRFTWLNALLHRETNAPVSFQAELFQNGDFIYRYDLSSLPTQTLDGVTVGAWNAGVGDWFAPTSPALSSVRWHRLSIGDLVTPDRDGDGVPTASELLVYRTDPDLPDTDGDGIPDGAEITAGLDPLLRDTDADGLVEGSDPDPLTPTPLTDADGDGIPDAYEEFWFGGTGAVNAVTNRDETGFTLAGKILAGINPTNGVAEASAVSTNGPVTWKLFDGFAADWPAGGTSLVWERTFPVNRSSAWQQFFISAAPTNAAGWSLSGMVLEWDAGNGTSGSAASSPFGDSFRIPLPTNALPSVLTLRLRADGAGLVRSPSPLYLIAYSPEFRIDGEEVTGLSGAKFLVFTEGANSRLELVIDHSLRPCKASPGDGECDAGWLEGLSSCDPDVSFDGDATGGTIRAARPGIYTLPAFPPSVAIPDPMRPASGGNGGVTLAVLSPSVWWRCDGHGCTYDGLEYDWEEGLYHEEDYYPLDSKCLRKKWYRDRDGGWIDSACELSVTSGLGDDGDLVTTSADGDTGRVYVDGVEVWSGTAAHAYGESGGGGYSEDFLGDGCDECDTDCADGNCDSLEGTTLGSLKFRIPLGAPARGQVSGFVWFASDGPVRVSKSTFRLLRHPSANVTETEVSGTRRIVCQDPRGRDLRIEDIENGVRITIYETAAQTLEHTWEIVNVEGNPSQVRLRKISRLNNVMSDETYTCSGSDWTRFDNISGTETRLTTYDDFADYGDGIKIEMCETTNAVGRTLSSVMTHKSRVGECGNAVLRETYRQEWTGTSVKWSHADYWNDPSHSARHGQPRLVRGNARAWTYTDYDADGRETLRVEQRGNTEVPADFPYVVSNELCNASALADAFVTVRDYEPSAEDSCHPDDAAYPRTETRSVVTNGVAILIGCTRTRYTRLMRDGYAAVKKETWRDLGWSPSLATAAYSYEITYTDTGDGTPLLMRNATAETLGEDGILTVNAYTFSGGILSCERRRYSSSAGGAPSTATAFPTYEVTERDASYGTLLRRMTRLTDGDTIIADEQSIYDNKNRLRSTTYLDGTSLTNAYSCCRLLWKRDRERRKVLRSAQTGTDHLYHAEEDVWLANVSTNGGYRVIQHFSDALGRETNTVTYVGTTPGEAAVPIGEAALLPLQNAGGGQLAVATVTTSYPHGGSDYAIHTDERGKVTVSRTDIYSDHTETVETVFTNGVEVVKTKTRSYLGGGSSFRREWNAAPVPGGLPSPATAWTEEYRSTSYAADGRRVEYLVTASSDYPLVTNSVSTYDLLGRLVTTARLGANDSLIVTSNAYDGTTSRILSSSYTAGDVVRTTTYLYNDLDEQVGTVLDGITNRTDIIYETDTSNIVWRVETAAVIGPSTNSLTVTRTQLTGLSDACRRHMVVSTGGATSPLPAVVTETVAAFDPSTGIETETTTSSVAAPIVRRSLYGVLLSTETADTTTFYSCDAFGRAVAASRQIGRDALVASVQSFDYSPCGDLLAVRTYTNAADFTAESYAHDTLGNRVATTDA